MILLIITLFVTPWNLGFQSNSQPAFMVAFEFFIDAMFTIDMLLNFTYAYYD
jgi:hypothetical protein